MLKTVSVTVKLPPHGGDLTASAAAALSVSAKCISHIEIIKRSIDARRKPVYVYQLAVTLKGDTSAPPYTKPAPFLIPQKKSAVRPVVVGLGPAGLFGGLVLARAGMRPIVLERGSSVEKRAADIRTFTETGQLSEKSNVQFGEGGAGTFSDGKIGTGIKSPFIRFVTDTFIEHGAPPEIAYDAHPHIGSDNLPGVVKSIREEICKLGGTVHFDTMLTDFTVESGELSAVHTETMTIPTRAVLLAIGHSARDTFSLLRKKGAALAAKPFSIGVRIEHPREAIDRALYKNAAPFFPAADYRLVCHLPEGRTVYSFCMCPGGYVIPAASEAGGVVTNGYSLHARDGENSNSALLVGITPADCGTDVFDGIRLQREIETAAFRIGGGAFRAPCQTVGDFLENRPSKAFGAVLPTYARGVTLGNVADCLPPFVTSALRDALPLLAKKLSPFSMPDAVLTAPETRSSSPVRILRNTNGQSNIGGLFPAGEGSGYAGGIMSAAIDGIRAALSILDFAGESSTAKNEA